MMIPKEMVPGLVGKLLDSQDYDVITSDLKTDSDIQLLLEYILHARIPPLFVCFLIFSL